MTDERGRVEQRVARHTTIARGLTAVAAIAALSATGLFFAAGPSLLTNAGAAAALLAGAGAKLAGNRRDGYRERLDAATTNRPAGSEGHPSLDGIRKRLDAASAALDDGELETAAAEIDAAASAFDALSASDRPEPLRLELETLAARLARRQRLTAMEADLDAPPAGTRPPEMDADRLEALSSSVEEEYAALERAVDRERTAEEPTVSPAKLEDAVRGARTAAEETAVRASTAATAQRARTRERIQGATTAAAEVAARESTVTTARREATADAVRSGAVTAREVDRRATAAATEQRVQTRTDLQRAVSAAGHLAETATARLRDQRTSSALDDAQHELNRSRGHLSHDVEESRARLDAASGSLDDATDLTAAADSPAAENVDRLERYREQVETMRERCREQEAEEAVQETLGSVEDGTAAFRDGDIGAATDHVTTARERTASLPSRVDDESVERCRTEIETLERRLARHSVAEFVANAESTVDEAAGARKAGEAAEAIETYRRALGSYDAALAEAEGEALPETTEIERRMDAIETAIEATRADWVDSRSTRLDRELRAGARAVSTGIGAAERGDEDAAEEAYETAERAADAARSLLAGEEAASLSLPEETQTEYRSATDSLTGHLGYLRTRIDESESPAALADATPLAEYYDGVYALHRAIPSESHPLWREAVSTVLFGGDGVASDAVHYGQQQAERNEASIQRLRDERGDGETIQEFDHIETAPPRAADRRYADAPLPVVPGSGEVLPVCVSEDDVLDAIELLAGLPAYPTADKPGGEADALLDVAYFREQFGAGPPSDSAEQAAGPDAPAVSETLDELQRELETMVNEAQ